MRKVILLWLVCIATPALLAAPGGFLFVTFKGESTPLTEQVYFALSPDGRTWAALNRSEPVLVSSLGEQAVRDPYLLRSHDGKKFYLLATDLSIHLNPDWRRAVQQGSKSIVIWESTDLANWSEPRLVRVAPDDAGCTWAPEAVYDEEAGDYLVFWASTTAKDSFTKHRIWASRTKDFQNFSAPFVYIDPPNPVIDTSIVRDGGRYYRFSKDEKLKSITMESSPSVTGPWEPVPDFSLGKVTGYEGPQCFVLQPASDTQPPTWCLLLDFYSRGRGYQAFVSQNLASGQFTAGPNFSFPFRFRHGSVLPLSAAEYERLQQTYGTATAESQPPARPVAVTTEARQWSNPILSQRADPHVILHSDGWYYFTATVPEYDRIELRRARTLGELSTAQAQVIWRKRDRGPMSHHIWAPEIHFIDGKWYVYFAAGRAEAIWDIRMYVLENASANPLQGQWTGKGQIRMNWESFTLDATTFEHRGSRYLAWAQSIQGTPGTSLFLAKMDTPWSITGEQVCLSRPELAWERIGHNVNEAPAVLHRNGRLFMTYSASATDANYCLGLLTANEDADLLDPKSWRKSSEPVFKSYRPSGQFGPGHNSFTTTPDGQTDILVYHARNYEFIAGDPLGNPDRATRAQVLKWNADGTPNFGVPVPDDLRRVHSTR